MHLFQDRDEVGKLNMERFALCAVWYRYMRLCMSCQVELYRGPSRSLLISYVGVDRCVDSTGAGKPRGFNYVCMTAVPFFSAARAGVADRDVEEPSLMAFFRGALLGGGAEGETFEHRGIALSRAPVWYARTGAAAAPLPSLLPPF